MEVRDRPTPLRGALLGLATVLGLACGGSRYEPASEDPATVYSEACVGCHQGGVSGPLLVGRRLDAEAVRKRLDSGGEGMPSFPRIRGEARRNLVDFVVRMSAGDP